jgi:hypothetical protein
LHSGRTEKVKVLLELHRRFGEFKGYRVIRTSIETKDCHFLGIVRRSGQAEQLKPRGSELIGQLDEYLGFFELLGHLWENVKFRLKDIDGLFGY